MQLERNLHGSNRLRKKISLFAQKNDVNEAKAEMRVEADGMISEALKSYVTSDDFGDYKTETKTRFEQTDNQFGFYVQKDTYDGLNSTVNNLKSNQENYFQFDANGLRIGKKNNPYQVVIDNEKISDVRKWTATYVHSIW